jgi:hypothetical protein
VLLRHVRELLREGTPAPKPPWDRFLDKPSGRFVCPGCGQTLDMHVSHGPGTPGIERFQEASALNY